MCGVVYASSVLGVILYLSSLGVPFYSPRGGPRLQDIDARIGLDRGMAPINSRLLYQRGLD